MTQKLMILSSLQLKKVFLNSGKAEIVCSEWDNNKVFWTALNEYQSGLVQMVFLTVYRLQGQNS